MPLVFLSKAGNSRSCFYGALLSHTEQNDAISAGDGIIKIFIAALLPVNVFSENNAPIVGNVAGRLGEDEVAMTLGTIKEKTNVWGFRTPLKYAQQIKR